MSNDMLWLKAFVDERIAAAHKETSAAPNTAHGSVVVDRYGHVINGMAGASSGSYTLLSYCSANSDPTLTSFDVIRIPYNTVEYDPTSRITTGATTWVFTVPATGWYHIEGLAHVTDGGNAFSAGDFFNLWLYNGSSNIRLQDTRSFSTGDNASVPMPLTCVSTIHLENGNTIHLRVENISGSNHAITSGNGSYIAIYAGPTGS